MVETLGEVLPFAARRYGGKTALVSDGRSFTFNELEAKSNAFANGLAAAGIRPGDTVTLYGPNSWQWLVAYYAIAKTGAVVNPVNVMLTPEELKFIIRDCGARAVVASADKAAALMDMKGNTGLSEVVIWGDKPPAGATPFDRWLEQGKPAFTPARRSPKDTGAICYTSGTTGHPKGAVQSIRSIVATAKGTALMHSRTSADTVVSPLPAPHVYGSCVLNAGVLVGATLVMLPRFSEEGVLDAIQTHRATMFDCVPTAYYYLLAHPKLASYDLASLTRCTVGGQTLPVAKSQEWSERTGVPVLELWGMTELAGAATFNPYWGDNKPGTIGLPMPGMSCKIVDVENAGQGDAAGRARRADDQGPAGHGRLRRRREEHQGDDPPRRLDAHRRHRHRRRGRLLHHRRPQEGHDPDRRLQRLPGRAGAGAVHAPFRCAGRGVRRRRRGQGGARQGLRHAQARRRRPPARSWSSTAAGTSPPTSFRAPCSSSPACRSRAPARSCAGC